MKLAYATVPIRNCTRSSDSMARRHPGPRAIVPMTCRLPAISESAVRLACYDRGVTSLDAAKRSKDVVIGDKEQVREAARAILGLALSHIKLFGGADDADDVTQIEASIAFARQGPEGWR